MSRAEGWVSTRLFLWRDSTGPRIGACGVPCTAVRAPAVERGAANYFGLCRAVVDAGPTAGTGATSFVRGAWGRASVNARAIPCECHGQDTTTASVVPRDSDRSRAAFGAFPTAWVVFRCIRTGVPWQGENVCAIVERPDRRRERGA